jgi:hypothetical protein
MACEASTQWMELHEPLCPINPAFIEAANLKKTQDGLASKKDKVEKVKREKAVERF